MSEIDPKRELLVNLTCFYRPPNHLEGEGQAKRYLAELADAFARMQPNAFEWDHVWNEFKREWTKTYWPLPSEFPQRLMKFRAKQTSVRKAAGERQHDPAPAARQIEHRPYNHGEFMAAVRQAHEMAASTDPFTAMLGRSLSRCADGLLRNRDDQDRPRYADAAE